MENKILLKVDSDRSTALIVMGIIFCITIVLIFIGIPLLILAFSRKETLIISTCTIQGEGRIKGNSFGTKVASSNYVVPVSYISYISLKREKSFLKKAKGTIIIGCDSTTIYFGPTKKCDEIYKVLNELVNKKHYVETSKNMIEIDEYNLKNKEIIDDMTAKENNTEEMVILENNNEILQGNKEEDK